MNDVYNNPLEFTETKKFANKYEEYVNGEWRSLRGQKTKVTLESQFPALPEKPIERPNQEAFKKKQKDLNIRLKEIFKSLNEKRGMFEETLAKKKSNFKDKEQLTGPNGNEIGQLAKKSQELRSEKGKVFDQVNKIQKELDEVKAIRDRYNEQIDREYNTEELVKRGIKKV